MYELIMRQNEREIQFLRTSTNNLFYNYLTLDSDKPIEKARRFGIVGHVARHLPDSGVLFHDRFDGRDAKRYGRHARFGHVYARQPSKTRYEC